LAASGAGSWPPIEGATVGIALQVAFGHSGRQADQAGALRLVASVGSGEPRWRAV
jgi:hypothetical protein